MVYFISGIDTDVGKTVATGLLAKALIASGVNVITQKFIQTGCVGISEDILKHREIMGVEPLDIDRDGTTCRFVMSMPASPHLAAEIDSIVIDIERISEATEKLESLYDIVLLEGAGGLFVPVTRDYYTIDYICEKGYPLILVTSSKLGSINHTLLSLEACRHRNIEVSHVIYNYYPNDNRRITEDSVDIFKRYLIDHYPGCKWIEMPVISGEDYPNIDISHF